MVAGAAEDEGFGAVCQAVLGGVGGAPRRRGPTLRGGSGLRGGFRGDVTLALPAGLPGVAAVDPDQGRDEGQGRNGDASCSETGEEGVVHDAHQSGEWCPAKL